MQMLKREKLDKEKAILYCQENTEIKRVKEKDKEYYTSILA